MGGGGNIVEITISAINETQAEMDAAKAGADETAASYDTLAGAADKAAASSDELAAAQGRQADAAKVSSDASEGAAAKTDESSVAAEGGAGKLKLLALGLGAAAAGSVYLGMKFTEASTQLVTGAGQSASGLKQVEQGMLAVSSATATSSTEVVSGMYLIESAGYHGSEGLKVLQAAAEGAKVGNASLASTANVLTSALNAYHEPASNAVAVTDQLVATVGAGKMHMQDLTTAMASVLPVAASYGVSLGQVGGALSTMTLQGMTARRASTDLAFLLRSLAAPGATAQAALKGVGLSAQQVSNDLSTHGLAGTLAIVNEAIKTHTTNDYQAREAMLAITGGATGLNTALMLTGGNASKLAANTKTVSDAAANAGPNVSHWGDITADTAFRLDKAKTSAENLGISVGMTLLPAVTKILGVLDTFVSWIGRSKTAIDVLAVAIGATLTAYAIAKAVEGVGKLAKGFQDLGSGIAWLAGKLGLTTAATEAQTVATEEQAVATEGATVAQEGFNMALLANPVTLIVAAIGLLVLAFIELWTHVKGFRDFFKDAWADIKQWTSDAVDFVKDHLLQFGAALLGPLAPLAELVIFIVQHWNEIKQVTADLVADVTGFFEQLPAEVMGQVSRLTGDVVGWFERLPGEVMNAISHLATDLFNFGAHIVEMLASGIESAVGSVTSAIGHIGSEILDHIPHSPAKKGPLSGSGSPDVAGRKIAQMLAQGMAGGVPSITSAAASMARAAGIVSGGGSAGGTAGTSGWLEARLELQPTGNAAMDALMEGAKLWIRGHGGGGTNSVQVALGQNH